MSNGEVTTVGIPSLFGLTGTKTAFQDEGILLGNAQAVNFVGDGVTATLSSGVLTVNITSGSSMPALVTTLEGLSAEDTTHPVAASAVVAMGQYFVDEVVGGLTAEDIGADESGAAATAEQNAKDYADGLLVGLWKDQGNFDASSGLWPTSSSTIGLTAIVAGFLWKINVAGTLTGGVVVDIGDVVRALVNNAGNTATDWAVIEGNDGYVPENESNKATDFSIKNSTKYPSTQAVDENYLSLNVQTLTTTKKAQVKTNIGLETADDLPEKAITSANKYFTEGRVLASVLTGISFLSGLAVVATDNVLVAIGKLQKQITDLAASAVTQSSLRYVTVIKTLPAPIIDATDVTPTGSKLVVLDYASATTCTIDTPNNLGKTVGDSVNIIQGNVGPITITASSLVGAKTTATTAVFTREGETKTFIATSSSTWRVIGG